VAMRDSASTKEKGPVMNGDWEQKEIHKNP
jgi:hypothetical protein